MSKRNVCFFNCQNHLSGKRRGVPDFPDTPLLFIISGNHIAPFLTK